MTRIIEERFKKADRLLTTKENEFLAQGCPSLFTAFVDFETWHAFQGHVRSKGYGEIKNESGIDFIQFRHWKIFWLPDDKKEDNIKILMFPCEGVYQIEE